MIWVCSQVLTNDYPKNSCMGWDLVRVFTSLVYVMVGCVRPPLTVIVFCQNFIIPVRLKRYVTAVCSGQLGT